MKILITPHDIIERALWYKYEYYILDGEHNMSREDIDEIIRKNEEFEISERDALIINLVKCIETDNLVHRLNQHLLHILSIKSTDIQLPKKKNNTIVIRKNALEYELDTYSKNFPSSWEPKLNYQKNYELLVEYIKELKENLDKLEIIEGEFQGNKIEYVQVNHFKKQLNFNH
jgi:hypothetical protein